jgi:hypothetical protein
MCWSFRDKSNNEAENNTSNESPFLHTYIEFTCKKNENNVKGLFIRAGLKNADVAIRKESKIRTVTQLKKFMHFDEHGQRPRSRGQHVDKLSMEQKYRLIEKVGSVDVILKEKGGLETIGSVNLKTVDRWASLKRVGRENDPEPIVVWFYGNAGAGKTVTAKKWMLWLGGHFNTKMDDTEKFWTNIDSTSMHWMMDNVTFLGEGSIRQFLGLGGTGDYQIPCKGTTYPIRCTHLAVTSCKPPRGLWNNLEKKQRKGVSWKEIRRRIKVLVKMVEGTMFEIKDLEEEGEDIKEE